MSSPESGWSSNREFSLKRLWIQIELALGRWDLNDAESIDGSEAFNFTGCIMRL